MIRLPSARTKHTVTLATLLAAAIALGGCGVKGPLRPAPARKAPATAPGAATAPGTAPEPAAAPPAATPEPTTPGKPAS